ncbi:hypothetical protein ACFPN0_29685 [Kitasatospora cinereorecta]
MTYSAGVLSTGGRTHGESSAVMFVRTTAAGPDGTPSTLDVRLDIPEVDVCATVLKASVRIPVIDVGTPRIRVGADVVPAHPPLAGRVLVDACDVRFTGLTAPRT